MRNRAISHIGLGVAIAATLVASSLGLATSASASTPAPTPTPTATSAATNPAAYSLSVSVPNSPGGGVLLFNTYYDANNNGQLTANLVSQIKLTGAVSIPSSINVMVNNLPTTFVVRYVWGSALANATKVTSIVIPDTIVSIKASAFQGDTALQSVKIGALVTTIKDFAFQGDAALTSVTIGAAVATIHSSAFAGDTALTSIVIPGSVTEINDSAFAGDSSLASVIFSGKTAPAIVTDCNSTTASFPSNVTVHYATDAVNFQNPFWNSYTSASDFTGMSVQPLAVPGAKCFNAVAAAAAAKVATDAANAKAAAAKIFGYLGSAGTYSVLANAAITAPASKIQNGYIGTGAALTTDGNTNFVSSAGPNVNEVTGSALTNTALNDLTSGYNTLRVITATTELANADLSTVVLTSSAKPGTITPGVYHSVAALTNSGSLTFDAQGDSNAVFIIESNGAITTAAATTMSLANGAQASNIYWISDAATTIGAASVFDGNIISNAAITIGAASIVNGRAMSVTAAVTLDANLIDSSATAGM